MKHWLRKDEDTSTYTVLFFDRMKKEIKRSLKVTIDAIKHPESLGARRKRNRSSVQVYPSLPTTEEVTEENTTSETAKWVNNTCTRTTKMDNKEVMSTSPPDYDQSEKSHQNVVQEPPAYNVQDTETPAMTPGHYQVQSPGNGAVPSREETEEEMLEKKKQQLARRKVPTELWDYYLKSPEHWDFDDVNEDGLQKGISAILIAPHTVAPCWVEK